MLTVSPISSRSQLRVDRVTEITHHQRVITLLSDFLRGLDG
jgi:hypothetical protein